MKKTGTLILILFIISFSSGYSQTWLSMVNGLGISSDSVRAIAVDPSGNVYAGGTFTGTYNYLARWNGTSWTDLGSTLNGPVNSIGIKTASDIYVGGEFTVADGITVNRIARFNGSNFSALDSGFNATVKCVYVNSLGDVYAGGQFSLSGSTVVNHIAKLVSGQWITLGSGISGTVNAIMLNNSILYAGSEIILSPLYKFENNTWSVISGISNGKIFALASFKNNLFAGGDFQLPFYAAARWDGSGWSSITTNFTPTHKIFALLTRKDSILYIGGNFTGVGVGTPNYIGKIDGLANSPVKEFTTGNDLSGGEVYAIGNVNGKVIAGGKFTTPATNMAITSTTIDVSEISRLVVNRTFFPNPARANVHLKVTTAERLKNPELKIFDVQSKLIQNLPVEKKENIMEIEFIFNCSNLSSGIYYYVLSEDGENILSDKFVVE